MRILSGNSKLGSGNTIIFLANKNRNPNGFLSARGVRANHNFLLNDGPRPPAKNKASEGIFVDGDGWGNREPNSDQDDEVIQHCLF